MDAGQIFIRVDIKLLALLDDIFKSEGVLVKCNPTNFLSLLVVPHCVAQSMFFGGR